MLNMREYGYPGTYVICPVLELLLFSYSAVLFAAAAALLLLREVKLSAVVCSSLHCTLLCWTPT